MTAPTDRSRSDSGRPKETLRTRTAEEREQMAEAIAERLDGPITAAGFLFAAVVLAETVSRPTGGIGTAFTAVGWVLWMLFVGEFVLRLLIAPSAGAYLRRNWWQVVFLAVPALRFLRAMRALRAARVGRVVGSAIRSTRSAGRKLSSRLSTLVVSTGVTIIASSQVLFEIGAYARYGDALYATALAVTAGEPLSPEGVVAKLIEVSLLAYSVVVFAALAGMVGAFLLERGR